jgi:hypothetical protein
VLYRNVAFLHVANSVWPSSRTRSTLGKMIVTVVVGNVRAGLPDTCPLNDGRFDNESQRPRERRNALVLTSKGFGSPLTGAHHGLGRDICRFFRLTCLRTTDFAFAYDSGEVADVEGVGHGRRHAATAPAGHRRGQEGPQFSGFPNVASIPSVRPQPATYPTVVSLCL